MLWVTANSVIDYAGTNKKDFVAELSAGSLIDPHFLSAVMEECTRSGFLINK